MRISCVVLDFLLVLITGVGGDSPGGISVCSGESLSMLSSRTLQEMSRELSEFVDRLSDWVVAAVWGGDSGERELGLQFGVFKSGSLSSWEEERDSEDESWQVD